MTVAFAMVGCADVARAGHFWDQVLAPMGLQRQPDLCSSHRLAWWKPGAPGLFQVGLPFEGDPTPGNGVMVGFEAATPALVDHVHALALAAGGQTEGAPGARYPGWYGGYFRDPDGNKAVVFALTGE